MLCLLFLCLLLPVNKYIMGKNYGFFYLISFLSLSLSDSLSLSLSLLLPITPSISLVIFPSNTPFMHYILQQTCQFLSVYQSLCFLFCLSILLYVCLSVRLSSYLSLTVTHCRGLHLHLGTPT